MRRGLLGKAHDQGRQKLSPHYHEDKSPIHVSIKQLSGGGAMSPSPCRQNNVFIAQDQVKVQQRNLPPHYYYVTIPERYMQQGYSRAWPSLFLSHSH